MADVSLSASGKDEKKVSRVNSFTNFIRSPSRPKSMRKSSSNPLSRLLFRRKSSKDKDVDRKDDDEGSTGGDGGDDAEDEDAPSMIEEVKEVVGTAIDNVLHHHHKHPSTEEGKNDAAVSTKSRDGDVPSTDVAGTKEHKPSLLDKFKEEVHVAEHSADHLTDKLKEGLGKAKESFKGDYDKAKEGVESILHIDHKSSSEKKPVDIISDKKKAVIEEVKAPSLAKRVQEEVMAVVNTTKDDPKKGEAGKHEESTEIKGVIKKEDGCVSSLAQGLEKMCAPWSSKKQV